MLLERHKSGIYDGFPGNNTVGESKHTVCRAFAEQRFWYNETCLIGLTVLGETSSSLKKCYRFYSLG